jgi:leucyl aminopeptidase
MTTRAGTASAPAPTADAFLYEPASHPSATVTNASLNDWSGDLLLLAVAEDHFSSENEVVSIPASSTSLLTLDKSLGGALVDIISEGGFEGKQGTQSKVVRVGAAPGSKAKFVAMVGVGKVEKLTQAPVWGPSWAQSLGTSAASLAKSNKSKSVGISFVDPLSISSPLHLEQMLSSAFLGGYETTRFKSKKSPTATKLESIQVLSSMDDKEATTAIAKAKAAASGTFLSRYLVEAPPNVCTPSHIANTAKHIADKFPSVMTLSILEKADCEKMGMGSYLGVSEASDEPPKFIHLTYKPQKSSGSNKVLALVGKGLTFDSGGYNLKAGPGSMIEMMKFDMGGAAATLGAARIIAEAQPEGLEVHFIVASCENMVAGHGLRPGDILTSASGKTIEVNNTDAEGRLTLADALWYAQEKCGAKTIVDSATLTGACMVALGGEIAGLFTPSEKMAEALTKSSKAVGEKVWRMPMEQNYWDSMKSPIADMKNTGSRLGGSITAALFLEKYINKVNICYSKDPLCND